MEIKSYKSGFTLLELMIVLVIIGLLAGIIGPNLFKNLEKSEKTTAKAQVDSFIKAIDQYRIDTGGYPSNSSGLSSLITAPSGVQHWNGPYIKKVPLDPWGMPYQYNYPGEHNTGSYDIYSFSKDKVQGGDKEDTQDIGNW
ncbi:type II secretion system protein GspG [Acinetobacter sp. Root1280]|uniref:type II secretion system major pseudopilin GspG n=1 Tax=Acinetobacter sp. Root1280 TaxID=1736444 RepID=UPI0006FDCE54|nr:type II secretion system major pseudopilin GspG [Acinetobacter sp. Root1280]KQW99762.1 type II secretion system protein GspG [Acinetobacter sp. Root1280]